ncbi:MAG: glycosyltransferase family 4 protein [Proteobacteria bacterium]|nr:glycosyltransferase family 4 protein [Pseudomonadota bacterium]MBU4259537.1 glycosyltransferase family 4 protein [Pseudomonadota bacterium]MBU4288506.1 glycosyltransferase family 4 protein [Pseudomonadota bacterium]MBU4413563.1 glycosyltransferase family 4 protein [Pseudomonadota bacterium]MCG2758336.1 glycosyltransferase family 4 protein [Desulfobacteraceae bacterium]
MNLAIIRPFANILSDEKYNVQEFGLAKALVKQNINVDVFCAGAKPMAEINELCGEMDCRARIIRMPFYTMFSYHGIFKGLFNLLKEKEYNIIQTQGYEQITSFLATWFGVKHSIPVVLHQGVYETDYGVKLGSIMRVFHLTLGKYMRRNISGCITKTDKAKEFLERKGFNNIETIPIGLDIEKFKPSVKADWKSKLCLKPSDRLLLYVGIIEPRRNVDFLINIIYLLEKMGEPVNLLIAGTGPDEKKCKKKVEELNLTKKVFFLGRLAQTELSSLYSDADLFVLPSNNEIVGMVLLESLYFGLPVLTTPTAGGLDIVNESNGKIFSELNEKKWVDFICDYFNDPDKYGFKKYLTQHPFERSWNTLGQRYAFFYQNVVDGYVT